MEERVETLAERDAFVRVVHVVELGEDSAAPFGDDGEVLEAQGVRFEWLSVFAVII